MNQGHYSQCLVGIIIVCVGINRLVQGIIPAFPRSYLPTGIHNMNLLKQLIHRFS